MIKLRKKQQVKKMKQKFTDDKKYPKACKNCFFGRITKDNQAVLCEKEGVVETNHCCRKYKYDPLKRVPNKTVIHSDYNEDDFKL